MRYREKLDNLLEYFGFRSKNYYHTEPRISYDPDNPMAYYIDQSHRAVYPGHFDSNGIPLYVGKGKTGYLPVFICTWALGQLETFRQKATEESRTKFLKAVDWLVSQQKDDGVWLTDFPMDKFGLYEPFPCAMVQGLAISCLTRAFLMTNKSAFLDSAVQALAPYCVDVRDGGVASDDEGQVFYEEFPSIPYHHVLNGFIFAMWGLNDLARINDNRKAKRLYDEGLKTLIEWLPRFDLGHWSLYHIGDGPKNPATVPYHRLHIIQLKVMYALTGHDIFKQSYLRWSEYLHGRFNALRTLPAKLWWILARAPARQ